MNETMTVFYRRIMHCDASVIFATNTLYLVLRLSGRARTCNPPIMVSLQLNQYGFTLYHASTNSATNNLFNVQQAGILQAVSLFIVGFRLHSLSNKLLTATMYRLCIYYTIEQKHRRLKMTDEGIEPFVRHTP